MVNDNYLMVNGVKIDLTEEQIEKLKVDVEKSKKVVESEKDKVMFDRVEEDNYYYHMDAEGEFIKDTEEINFVDTDRFNMGNYCREKYPLERKAVLMELVSKMYNHIWVTGGKELLCEKRKTDAKFWTAKFWTIELDDENNIMVSWDYNNSTLLSFPTEASAQSFIDENRELLNKWFM